SFTTVSRCACVVGVCPVITDKSRHQVPTRRTSARLWHTHPVTGNSVPQLSPPFRDRRPGRPQQRWYVDSAGSCVKANAHAALASSSHQSFARQAGLLHSSIIPGLLL